MIEITRFDESDRQIAVYFRFLKKFKRRSTCLKFILTHLPRRTHHPGGIKRRPYGTGYLRLTHLLRNTLLRNTFLRGMLRDATRGGVPLYGVFHFPASAKKMLEQNQGHQVKGLETRIFKNETKKSGTTEFLFLFTSKMTYFQSKRVNMNTNKIKNRKSDTIFGT